MQRVVVLLPGIIRARTYETHGEDGVTGHLVIGIVRVLVEDVRDGHLGIREGTECHAQ